MDTSSTLNSKENDSLVEPLSPEFADEGWDLGFSSPFRDLMSEESPVKSDIPTTPPLSPPSLGALRLFDSPQTPKSLLERSSAVNRTIDFKRPVSRLRRGLLKGRGFESEPHTGPRSRQVTANVNPFTPEASSIGAKRTKRTRNKDKRWAFSLWSLVFVSPLILASTLFFFLKKCLTILHFICKIFVQPRHLLCMQQLVNMWSDCRRPTGLCGNLSKNIPWILKHFFGLKQSLNSVKIACFLLTVSFICKKHQLLWWRQIDGTL